MVATSAIHALITHISVPETHGHCTKWRYWCQSLLYTVQCIHIFAAHNWNIRWWERATATECSYIFSFCGQCFQRMSLNMYDTPWWARARKMNTTVICTSCGHWENIVGSLPPSFQGLLNPFRLHYAQINWEGLRCSYHIICSTDSLAVHTGHGDVWHLCHKSHGKNSTPF